MPLSKLFNCRSVSLLALSPFVVLILNTSWVSNMRLYHLVQNAWQWLLPTIVSPSGASVDSNWHAPNATAINDLNNVLQASGVYGFIFNTSTTPPHQYGSYNWCNMPHVRKLEYKRAPKEYELVYLEIVSCA